MKIIADLHIHSKYSRATSPKMEVETLALWAEKKGINLIATGDITHPAYVKELKNKLVEDGSGFLKFRKKQSQGCASLSLRHKTKFILSGEIACIYKDKGKCRRLHHIILLPDLISVVKVNAELEKRGCNIRSDGRPIIGLSSKDLLKLLLEINPRAMLIPAHAWTPWFAIFGSKSGYDSIEECFEELSSEIFAIETGLSSDPAMNWRLSALDNITLISNSDAHSPIMTGREANVFEFEEFTYDELRNTLKNKDFKKFLYTIEFYPQEGKYHYDGHRSCEICFSPEESLRNKNICPKCKKPLVLGVDHRVAELADRELGFKPENQIPFKSIIPLYEIIAECLGVGRFSKRVLNHYEKLIKKGSSEFNVLLELPKAELEKITSKFIAEAICRMRSGQISARPGYDGEFGKISVYSEKELKDLHPQQKELF